MENLRRRSLRFRGYSKIALLVGSGLASGLTAPAIAQPLPPDAPPVRTAIDAMGVDVTDGTPTSARESISIGSPENGLTFNWKLTGGYNRKHDYLVFMTVDSVTQDAQLYIGDTTRTFTFSSNAYTSDQGDGSTFVSLGGGNYRYKSSDGVIINFGIPSGASQPWALSQVSPNGERLDFHHKTKQICFTINGNLTCSSATRVQSVTSNFGYQAKLGYLDNTGGVNFTVLTSVKLINNSVEYCDQQADSCILAGQWPTLSWNNAYSGSDEIDTVTNSLGQVTQYIYSGSIARLRGIKRPTSATNDLDYTYDSSGRVASASVPGRTINYSWSVNSNQISGSATDSLGNVRNTISDTNLHVLLSDTDGLLRTVVTQYDSYGRPTSITLPEGNNVQFMYDTRGNITETQRIGKLFSAPLVIVTTAGFEASCANPAVCNKPKWTRDARGSQTDYTYDETTGQVLTVTRPAPVSGGIIRPKITMT